MIGDKLPCHTIYEDNDCLVILDKYPIDNGHSLIITKKHSEKIIDMNVTNQDVVDYLSLLATKTGTKIEVISGVSEHGSMVLNLGSIGAILRYNPNYTS